MLKRLTGPIRGFFNPRFIAMANSLEALDRKVDALSSELRGDSATGSALSRAISDTVTGQVRGSLDDQHADLLGAVGLLGRSVDQSVDQLAVLIDRTDPERASDADHLAAQLAQVVRAGVGLAFDESVSGTVAQLDQRNADVANFALSHRGWASQSGLWFNPPISVEHAPGGLRVADINERVAELPFVHSALGPLPRGSRVLDIGATESTVAIGLASLGHRVTAVDPRPYPLGHPNLTVHIGPIETFAPGEPFDAAVFLSSIEHFGLGAYGLPVDDDADVAALRRVRDLLRPGGHLVLTSPYGDAPTTDLQRTYRPEQVDAMLEGWDVQERSYLSKVNRTEWVWSPTLEDLTGSHVVLVHATKPTA